MFDIIIKIPTLKVFNICMRMHTGKTLTKNILYILKLNHNILGGNYYIY